MACNCQAVGSYAETKWLDEQQLFPLVAGTLSCGLAPRKTLECYKSTHKSYRSFHCHTEIGRLRCKVEVWKKSVRDVRLRVSFQTTCVSVSVTLAARPLSGSCEINQRGRCQQGRARPWVADGETRLGVEASSHIELVVVYRRQRVILQVDG